MIGNHYVPTHRHLRLKEKRDQLKQENKQLKKQLMTTKRIDCIIETLGFIRKEGQQPPLSRYQILLILAKHGKAMGSGDIQKAMGDDVEIHSSLRTATGLGLLDKTTRQMRGRDRHFYALTPVGHAEAIRLLNPKKERVAG